MIRRILTWLPLGFTVLIFMGYLLLMLIYARSLFAFPLDYDQGEGFELYDGIRLARGEGIYLDNAQFPFYASNYPPVYRLMLVPLIWLFGAQIWVGRVLTFACTLLIGALIFLNLKWKMENGKLEDTRSQFSIFNFQFSISLIAALAFFAANYVYQIAPLARAHLPMVMFAVAGITCLDRAFVAAIPNPQSPILNLKSLGIALLIIAGFTKLQAIDALAAGFGYVLLQQPRWGSKALAISVAITGLIVLWLNSLTGGQFWLNVVAANVNAYSFEQTWRIYREWFSLQAPLILCASLYVLWDVVDAIRYHDLRRISVWSFYFVTGCAMGMLTGKWGAGPAYLIAAIAAACVLTAKLLLRIREQGLKIGHSDAFQSLIPLFSSFIFLWQATLNLHLPTSGRIFSVVATVLGVSGQSSYSSYPYYDSVGYTQLGHLLTPQDLIEAERLVQFAKSVNGPVWSEEAMITLRADKDVVTNPTQLYNLAKNNTLDTRQMIMMINERRFGLVILKAEFYPPDVLEAIGKNYDRQYPSTKMNGFDYWLLKPKTK